MSSIESKPNEGAYVNSMEDSLDHRIETPKRSNQGSNKKLTINLKQELDIFSRTKNDIDISSCIDDTNK